MPNWAYQKLKFTYHGDNKNRISEIKEYFSGENGCVDFNKIIPAPANMFWEAIGAQEQKECDAKGIPTWNNWCPKEWGTKWNACDSSILIDDDWKLCFQFKTAWSIPEPIIEAVFSQFKDCNLTYICADDGGWFAVIRELNDDGEDTGFIQLQDNNAKNAVFAALNFSY